METDNYFDIFSFNDKKHEDEEINPLDLTFDEDEENFAPHFSLINPQYKDTVLSANKFHKLCII